MKILASSNVREPSMLRTVGLCLLFHAGLASAAGAVVDYGPPTREHVELRAAMIKHQSLQMLSEVIPVVFRLPRTMTLRARECDTANAWYRPSDGAIEVCYGYVAQLQRQLSERDAWAMLGFTLFHEVAHLLIAELRLPVLGREEDAADRFAATFTLATDAALGATVVSAAAKYFQGQQKRKEPTFWDEHSTPAQRFYDLLCLMRGRSVAEYERHVDGEVLPAPRAAGCAAEYREAHDAWNELLRPYSRVRGGNTF